MSNPPFTVPVKAAEPDSVQKTELDVLNDQQKAEAKKTDAQAEDIKALTELKKDLAGSVLFFMYMWFGALILLVVMYVAAQTAMNKEVPKEVIIAAFTTSAVVLGLVGYILKGLFGSKE
jgi:hypothetical protein